MQPDQLVRSIKKEVDNKTEESNLITNVGNAGIFYRQPIIPNNFFVFLQKSRCFGRMKFSIAKTIINIQQEDIVLKIRCIFQLRILGYHNKYLIFMKVENELFNYVFRNIKSKL